MATQITSRQFSQDAGAAKKAAEGGPVFITDRGRPAHVLLTFDAYEELLGVHVVDRLGAPDGIEDVELNLSISKEPARAAGFE